MIRGKHKKMLALILSGVLLAGSVQPMTVSAEEASDVVASEEAATDESSSDESSAESRTEEQETTEGEGSKEEGSKEEGSKEEASEAVQTGTDETQTTDIEEETQEKTTEEPVTVEEQETETETEAETETETETEIQEEKVALDGGREIAQNLLSDYNTSFEGAGSDGIYWWNDLTWKQTGISQKKYDDQAKPTQDCGDYYLEVISTDAGSGAQICVGDIAKLIKPGVTYEYSYLAKLSDGVENGNVSIQINSISSDWSSSKEAEFEQDKDVTLESAQWKQISGTFKLPEHDGHDQVAVKFIGADNVSFCVDDLRIAAIEEDQADYGDNLVKNPYFAESDLSVWEKSIGNATISADVADDAIFDDVCTYGVISDRQSSQDCFAQDMTDSIRADGTYEYSFWVMLDSEDYKDAPAEQREVCFAPYVSVGGETTYWGSYSSGILDSGCIKQIPAGEWVKFEGTFNPKFEGDADALVIRILEQGTNYGSGDCVKGKYYVTGVSIREKTVQVKEIEWDIPNFKDTVSSENGIGTDAHTGAAIMLSEITDGSLMNLVEKHFNAVTFGNELKMDALFGYHDNNQTAPGFETITWTRADGTVMENYTVPVFDFSRAEKMLDQIKEWNDAHPADVIKVRGHVLVWHSQAPEWFFHEDWDINKPDASAEVMDARQEWYIKTVLEHFTGSDSPYKDMFYGWDVVNEAVSDNSGTYRSAEENSSWWRVYGNQDFIINAFRYANRYAPSSVELYYNDYNECMGNKVSGIEKLLKEVKSHESDAQLPTRISGMGMQGHYTIASPTVNQIRTAATAYGKIVGKVQLTELDLKASEEFDGTDATLQNEYTKQAYRYKEIYDVMREVDAEEGIDVNGITVWGVIDGNSWLQTNNSVGGASDGSKRQVPLLFDDDYKAKPAFYAFVNADKLEPYTRNITVVQSTDDDVYANGIAYEMQGTKFIPVWTDQGLKVKVTVSDNTVDESDSVQIYVDWNKSMSEGAEIVSQKQLRSACQAVEGGYVAEFEVPKEILASKQFGFDIVISDNGQKVAFNDYTMSHDNSSKYFASAIAKPYMAIRKAVNGMVSIDGKVDSVWNQVQAIPLNIKTGSPEASVTAKLLWDEQYLYVLADITDATLDSSAEYAHEQDSFEVFIDENNHKSDSYEEDDKQYRVNFENLQSFNGTKCNADNIVSAAEKTENGYLIEAAYKWTDITPAQGDSIGIEMQINDAKNGSRIGTVSWYDESGQGWSSPSVFGNAKLSDSVIVSEPNTMMILDIKDQIYTGSSIKPQVTVYADGIELTEGKDYKVSYKNNVNAATKAGTGKGSDYSSKLPSISIEGRGKYKKYKGDLKVNFTILPLTLPETIQDNSPLSASYNDVLVMSSNSRKPSVTLRYNKTKLSTANYTLQYCKAGEQELLNAIPKNTYGEYNIIVKGKKNLSGEMVLPVRVAGVNMSNVKITLDTDDKSMVYDGSQHQLDLSGNITFRVANDIQAEYFNANGYTKKTSGKAKDTQIRKKDTVILKDTDYEVSVYKGGTNAGNATYKVTGKGFFGKSKNVTVKIAKANISNATVSPIADQQYTKKAIKPVPEVYFGNTLLNNKKDYTIRYSNNSRVSTEKKKAKIIITGRGNYTGKKVIEFSIVK